MEFFFFWIWGNETWGNGTQTADILLQGKVNGHVCTHWEIIFTGQLAPKGYATSLHHSLQANSMYNFFTFASLLAISLKLWIVHALPTLHKVEASSCTCLHCYGYHMQHYYKNSMYSILKPKLISIFNRSSQNACCSHSSVDTHTGCVCLHALSGGGNVQQLYIWLRQFYLLSDKVDSYTHWLQFYCHVTVSNDFLFQLSH